MVEDADALVDAVLQADEVREQHADGIRAWQERFTARDDGQSGRRVVQRMLDAGWFD